MSIPKLQECVGESKRVRFVMCRDGELVYVCDNGFLFPVPLEDVRCGTLLAEDDAVHYTRWIHRRIEFMKRWKPLQTFAVDETKENAQ